MISNEYNLQNNSTFENDNNTKYAPIEKNNKRIISFMDFSNFDAAWKTAEMISKARCIPKEFQGNPADILVAIEYGNDLGLRPMASLQNIMIVNNKPSIYGDAMLAVCMAFPDFIDCIETYNEEEETAYCLVKRKGREQKTKKFSKKMAITAQLWGKVSSGGIPSPWVTFPERMLQLRARAFALRDMFPDVLKGIPTVEEMRDIEIQYSNEPIKNTADSLKESLKNKLNLNKFPENPSEFDTLLNSNVSELLTLPRVPELNKTINDLADLIG